jgi:hypothetical protein
MKHKAGRGTGNGDRRRWLREEVEEGWGEVGEVAPLQLTKCIIIGRI